MAISNKLPGNTQAPHTIDKDRPKSSSDNAKKDSWSSMLDGVASGKRLPEKTILVLGGSSESQKELLEALSSTGSLKRTQDRLARKQPPIANSFALGFTYLDVLDAEQEDIVARLSVYMLADPSPSFAPLLKPLLNPNTIPNTLLIILLDWSQPWLWIRQLRDWIRLLRSLLVSLDAECKIKMEEVMLSWRDRGRGTATLEGAGTNVALDDDVNLPLGPGAWEEPLGLPLCVVCQNSDRMETLEREQAWKEEDFDFVLQFLRTVLLKHGASLAYTIPSVPSPLQTLVHSSLGIQSLLKRQPLRHNVIDREKVLVPANWDSWGKIRVLRDGFEVERVNHLWSVDIGEFPEPAGVKGLDDPFSEDSKTQNSNGEVGEVLRLYEDTIQDPGDRHLSRPGGTSSGNSLEVQSQDPQEFLASQLEVLERIRQAGGASDADRRREGMGRNASISETQSGEERTIGDEGRVNEHIGPVQFNMGGIQVDADDMLQRLKDRQTHHTPDSETPRMGSSPDGKAQNEALASFFAGLMKRGGGGSAASSPKPGV